MSDGEDAGPSGSAMSAMLQEIRESQKKLDEKFAQFRDEVKRGQEDAAEKALKRVCREKPHVYKRKGNEEQASFNEKVEETIVAAQVELEGASSGVVGKAKKNLEQGLALLSERQKLIKLADRSEHGWGVVAEYTADELAEDSDDEKRIFKAEKAAERKAAKRRKTVAPLRPKARVQTSLVSAASTGGSLQQVLPRRTVPIPQSYAQAVRPVRPPGPCLACGELGHVRSCCPKIQDFASKKWPRSMATPGTNISRRQHQRKHLQIQLHVQHHPFQLQHLLVNDLIMKHLHHQHQQDNILKSPLRLL